MSDRSRASGSVRSAAGAPGPHTTGSLRARHELVLDALYERKRDNKSVRVLTVLIYVFSVSLAAIILSLYYVFFWEPKDAQYAQRKVAHTIEKQTSTTPLPTCLLPYTGGSNITIKDSNQELLGNSSNPFAETTKPTDPQMDFPDASTNNLIDTADFSYEDHNNNITNDPTLNITNSIT